MGELLKNDIISHIILLTYLIYLSLLDGINVEIEGDDNGKLRATQGSDAKLDCIVKSKFMN